jgi:hypothetical protein
VLVVQADEEAFDETWLLDTPDYKPLHYLGLDRYGTLGSRLQAVLRTTDEGGIDLGETTDELVSQILAGAPGAIRLQKELMIRWRHTDLATAIRFGINAFATAYATGSRGKAPALPAARLSRASTGLTLAKPRPHAVGGAPWRSPNSAPRFAISRTSPRRESSSRTSPLF